MGKHILIGIVLIVLTSIVHLGATRVSIFIIEKSKTYSKKQQRLWNLAWLDAIVIMMILSSIVEAMMWAGCYVWVGAVEQFEDALYFSIVTYTTLGYGDITLNPDWRFLSSLEAASGIIIFGWSTAIVIAAFQNIYFSKKRSI